MRKAAISVAVVLGVMALMGPATAKFVGEATVEGPGVGTVADGGGITFGKRKGALYASQSGLFAGIDGMSEAPSTELGPRYIARFDLEYPGRYPDIVQHLYPYASGGPLVYTPAGQRWTYGGHDASAGWFRMTPRLLEALRVRGLPATSPVATGDEAAAASDPQPAPSPVIWGLVGLGALLAAGAIAGRRRMARGVA